MTGSAVLLAVPKRRVTHSRKRLKCRFNRSMPFIQSIVKCSETGTLRMPSQIAHSLMRQRLALEKAQQLE